MPHEYNDNWSAAKQAIRRAMRLIEKSRATLERSHRILNESDRRIWEAEVLRRDAEEAQTAIPAREGAGFLTGRNRSGTAL